MLGLPLKAQGERVAKLLESRVRGEALYSTVVVQMPRRATKTTSIWATIIGRAATRPGYRCVTTAQTGWMASRILLEHANAMVARGLEDDGTMRLYRNNGRERIEFPNGSRIWCVPPMVGSVRSAAADDILVDEAGEFEGPSGSQFLAAVRPLMDTRGPLAQLIVSGTPAKERLGMFWELLSQARSEEADELGLGLLDYSAREDEDPDDEKVWLRVHPGPSSGLTPLKVLRRRRKELDIVSWSREYLCVWPTDASVGALDVGAWKAAAEPFPEDRPTRSVIVVDAPKEQTSCSVVEVWRDEDGHACIEILAHRPGVSWAARFAHEAGRRLKVPVVFDEVGGNVTIAAEIRRMHPSVNVVPLTWKHVGAAAQLLATEVREGRVRHFDQPDLNNAVDSVMWRDAGRNGRAFGRRPGMAEISPIVAASLGLWHFDAMPEPQPLQIRVAS